jgi:hypothetical protein
MQLPMARVPTHTCRAVVVMKVSGNVAGVPVKQHTTTAASWLVVNWVPVDSMYPNLSLPRHSRPPPPLLHFPTHPLQTWHPLSLSWESAWQLLICCCWVHSLGTWDPPPSAGECPAPPLCVNNLNQTRKPKTK